MTPSVVPLLIALVAFKVLSPAFSWSDDSSQSPRLDGRFGEVMLMNKNSDSLIMKRKLIRSAKKSIDMSYFIVEDDPTSALIFQDVLEKIEKNRKIKVRILVDYFMSQNQIPALLMLSRQDRIQVRRFRPPSPELIRRLEAQNINPKAFLLGLIFQNKEKLLLSVRSSPFFKLISDHKTSGKWCPGDILELLVKLYQEMRDPELEKALTQFLMRTHHKLLVVDGSRFLMGGRNISDEYHSNFGDGLIQPPRYSFQDTDVSGIELNGSSQQESFNRLWRSELSVLVNESYLDEKFENKNSILPDALPEEELNKRARRAAHLERLDLSQDAYRVLSPLSGKLVENVGFTIPENKSITQAYADLISAAKTRVDIVTAYFYIDDQINDPALRRIYDEVVAASRRGVKVQVFTNSPSTTDLKIVNRLAYRNYTALSQAGVQIFELAPGQGSLHTKTMAIDDAILAVGSFNLDPRSHSFDTNNVILLKDESGGLVQAFRKYRVEGTDSLHWLSPDPEQMRKFMTDFLNIRDEWLDLFKKMI